VSFIHGYVEMLDFIAEEICAALISPLRLHAVICSGRTKQFMMTMRINPGEFPKKERRQTRQCICRRTTHQPQPTRNARQSRAKVSFVCARDCEPFQSAQAEPLAAGRTHFEA